MRVFIKSMAFLLLTFSSIFAQIELPAEGLVGHWKFDDTANLGKAEVGQDLIPATNLDGGTPEFFAVNGPDGVNGAAQVGLGTYLNCTHNIMANGPVGATGVNVYSLVFDFHLAAGNDVYYALYSTHVDINDNDATGFVEDDGAPGPGSLHFRDNYRATDTTGWYRLVVTIDLGDPNFYKNAVWYLDGQMWGMPRYLVSDGVDGRFALSAFLTGSNLVNLFGDNDDEDAPIDIAEVALYDRALSVDEAEALGGYGHIITFAYPVEDWSFNNAEDPFASSVFYGEDIVPIGGGVSIADDIVSVNKGSHFEADVKITARGGNNVNWYSIETDLLLPQDGVPYTILQTDATNSNDAVLKINERGQIGSDALGWSADTILTNQLYRVIMTVSESEAIVYLDGAPVLNKSITPDGDLSWVPGGKVLFFADNDDEDSDIKLKYLRIHNLALDAETVQNMGGYEHYFSDEDTPAKNAIIFNSAINQYGYVPYSDDFDVPLGGVFTVEMWMKPGPYYGDPAILGTKDWSGGSNPGWIIYIDGGIVDMRVYDSNKNGVKARGVAAVPLGRWAHVGFTVDTAKTSFFVNDSYKVKDNGYTTTITSGLGLTFGQDPTFTYDPAYNGNIDEVRIWKAVLTEETLEKWRHKKITPDHPNYEALVGYWDFDEIVQDSIFKDLSPKQHDITTVNNPGTRVSYAPMGNATMQQQNNLAAIWGFTERIEGEPDDISNTSDEMTISSPYQSGNNLAKKAPVIMGLNMANFDVEKFAIIGNNNLTGQNDADISEPLQQRLERVWYFDMTETFKDQKVNIDVKLNVMAGAADKYNLIAREGTDGAFTQVAVGSSVQDSIVSFTGIDPQDKIYITIATSDVVNAPIDDSEVGVEDIDMVVYDWKLEKNYPNPFNPSTTIEYSLKDMSNVKMSVYDVLGQKVATILDITNQAAGNYKVTWSTGNLVSGIYFYRIDAGDFTKTQKMILMK